MGNPQRKQEADWLVAAMKKAGLKNAELAQRLGLDNDSNVSQWRTGVRPMPDLVMLKVGKITGVSPYEVRPKLTEYLDVIGSESIFRGISEDSKSMILGLIESIRTGRASFDGATAGRPIPGKSKSS